MHCASSAHAIARIIVVLVIDATHAVSILCIVHAANYTILHYNFGYESFLEPTDEEVVAAYTNENGEEEPEFEGGNDSDGSDDSDGDSDADAEWLAKAAARRPRRQGGCGRTRRGRRLNRAAVGVVAAACPHC